MEPTANSLLALPLHLQQVQTCLCFLAGRSVLNTAGGTKRRCRQKLPGKLQIYPQGNLYCAVCDVWRHVCAQITGSYHSCSQNSTQNVSSVKGSQHKKLQKPDECHLGQLPPHIWTEYVVHKINVAHTVRRLAPVISNGSSR